MDGEIRVAEDDGCFFPPLHRGRPADVVELLGPGSALAPAPFVPAYRVVIFAISQDTAEGVVAEYRKRFRAAPGNMKRHAEAETRIVPIRYHADGGNSLYVPIPFLFVTERMCQEILAERELILGMARPAMQVRQRRLFARYDPRRSAAAFDAFLRLFAAVQDR